MILLLFLPYLDVILEHLLGNPVDALVDANPGLLQHLWAQVYQRHLVVRLDGHLQKRAQKFLIIYLPWVLCLSVCDSVCVCVCLNCGTIWYSFSFSNQTDQGDETEGLEREG